MGIVDKKKEELDKLQHQEIEKLEALSGLSADEAKERLVESLKEEAKPRHSLISMISWMMPS